MAPRETFCDHIARKGIESGERLGRRRWVIERTMSWSTGYHRLNHHYERHPRKYPVFLGLAAAEGGGKAERGRAGARRPGW